MARAYPKLKPFPRSRGRSENEYQRRLTSLKNRISSGRNWHLMQQKFSPGIAVFESQGGKRKFAPRTHEKVRNDEKSAYISYTTNSIDYYLILRQLISMPRALSTKVRENVKFELSLGWKPEEIAASNKISIRTVKRIKTNLNRFSVSTSFQFINQGRPRILTKEIENINI
jgi:hypothetical protein